MISFSTFFNKEIKEEIKEVKCGDDIYYDELFKRGDFVRIIYKENSHLNIYKGYNAEIRTYFKGELTANLILEALNSTQFIQFPIDHFIKRNV